MFLREIFFFFNCLGLDIQLTWSSACPACTKSQVQSSAPHKRRPGAMNLWSQNSGVRGKTKVQEQHQLLPQGARGQPGLLETLSFFFFFKTWLLLLHPMSKVYSGFWENYCPKFVEKLLPLYLLNDKTLFCPSQFSTALTTNYNLQRAVSLTSPSFLLFEAFIGTEMK